MGVVRFRFDTTRPIWVSTLHATSLRGALQTRCSIVHIKNRLLPHAGAVFLGAAGFLLTLAPSAPFTKELGVCESGAVRDVLAGHIILPRFLPGPIVHVPPLYWWIAALCVKALGWNEIAFRLPSLIAAALTCAIVFAWSGRLGLRVGLWSGAALLLCHFFLDAARQPRMDAMLAMFVTAAAVSLERAIAARAQAERDAAWYFAAAAAAIGLGALTKGILGIVLPGLVVALFLLVRGRLGELLRFDLIATFAAGLAIGLAWFLAGYRLGGRPFLEWQVQMNLWSRFIPAGAGGAGYCAHPFWYFAPQILRGFLPWSLYLPAFALAAWPVAGGRLPEAVVYTLCWFAALFIFFSSSHGKCLVYILPAFPPLAILAGWAIAQVQAGLDTRRRVRQLFRAGSAIIAIGAAVIVMAAITVIGYGVSAKIALRLHPTDRRFLELLVGQGLSAAFLLWAIVSLAGVGFVLVGLLRSVPGGSQQKRGDGSADLRQVAPPDQGELPIGRRPTRSQVRIQSLPLTRGRLGGGFLTACSERVRRWLSEMHPEQSPGRLNSEPFSGVLLAWGTLLIAAAGGWCWFAVMNPALAQSETLKTFARQAAALVPSDARIGHLGLGDCELNFYSPRPLEPISQISCADDSAAEQYVIIRKQDFDAMPPMRRTCFTAELEATPNDSIGPRLLIRRTRP